MKDLTAQQARVFAFIQSRLLSRGVTPSVEEIGTRLTMQTAAVRLSIDALVRKGYVRRRAHRPGALEILKRTEEAVQ